MRRGMYFFLTVGLVMCSLFFVSSRSSDDVLHAAGHKNPWAGQWACSVDSSHSEPIIISLQQLTINKNGTYTGIVKTAISSYPDDFMLDCTGSGTVTEVREGYITMEGTGECEQAPGILAESVADCVGMLRGPHGFHEMRCIDLTQEPDGQELLFTNTCKRQNILPK